MHKNFYIKKLYVFLLWRFWKYKDWEKFVHCWWNASSVMGYFWPTRPLFLRRPPQLRRPNATSANLTKQDLQVATTTARPTRIAIRKKIITKTRETTTPMAISTNAPNNETAIRSRFKFASRKPYLRTTTSTPFPAPDQELSNAGDIAVVLHGLSTAPLPLGPKPTPPMPIPTPAHLNASPASINTFSRLSSRFTFDRSPQRFPDTRHKGIAQIYDLSQSISPPSPNQNFVSRTPTTSQGFLTPEEYSKLSSPAGKVVSSTPSSRGSVTYATAFGAQPPKSGQIQFSSTPSPAKDELLVNPGTSGILTHTERDNRPQKLISTTLPPARSEFTFISQIPPGETHQVRTITSQEYPPGLLSAPYKQFSSPGRIPSKPSSGKNVFTFNPGGESVSIQPVTSQEYPRLSTTPPQRSERFTLITRGPGSEYDYYDATLFSRLPSNSKVLVLPTGNVQCLDRGNFPHPVSCRKFISCYEGGVGEGIVGWEYTCPRGLSFDPVGGICNWSAGLGCKQIN